MIVPAGYVCGCAIISRVKVLVTGRRDFQNLDYLERELIALGPTVIVHGFAPGADTCANTVARKHGIECRRYPADWTTHGRAAGPIRNRAMFKAEHRPDEPIDVCLAFPGTGKGTHDMMAICKDAGVRVEIR